jgi:hypothetical protein
MDIAFVRTQGQADRMYVRRTNGTEVSWSFPTFGNYIPHDLVHLVVESAFGLKNGFWGRVDAGVDVARINAEANKIGGANKYAKYGTDQADLFVAEMLAATRWGDSTLSDADLLAGILRSYSKLAPATVERITRVRETLDGLCARWINLIPKGAINAQFNPSDTEGSFQRLLRGGTGWQ